MDNKVLIILGMHRSGTSLITHWLSKCGLHIGDVLHGPDIGNREGHFEDVDFLSLHRQILESNKLPDNGLIHKPIEAISAYHREKLKSVVGLKNRLYPQWGWKEPRTCLFLPLYHEILPVAKYLIILRDFNAVVNSLIKREFASYEKQKLDKAGYRARLYWSRMQKNKCLLFFYKKYADEFLNVWIWYSNELLKHIKSLHQEDFIVVDYQMLDKNAEEVFYYLKDNWSFSLDYYDYHCIYKEQLMTDAADVSSYITDKSLLHKASELESRLKKYSFGIDG